jgi:hypothetical protein
MLLVCLDSQRLWGHHTGHSRRPPVSVRPTKPTGVDGAPPSDEAQAAYTAASEQYMFDLSDYEDWSVAEAQATQFLLSSMKVKIAMDLTSMHSFKQCGSMR